MRDSNSQEDHNTYSSRTFKITTPLKKIHNNKQIESHRNLTKYKNHFKNIRVGNMRAYNDVCNLLISERILDVDSWISVKAGCTLIVFVPCFSPLYRSDGL